jgi:hypothetical protein
VGRLNLRTLLKLTHNLNIQQIRFCIAFQITCNTVIVSVQLSTVKQSDKILDIVRKGPIRTFMSKNSWQRFNS